MKQSNKKKILVSGGAGFIGSHLCQKLLGLGNKVICLDNFFTGSKDNVKNLLDNRDFQLIEHDVTHPIAIEKLGQIYHLACPASPIHYQYNPVETIRTNVIGTLNMLDLAEKTGSRLLLASTSEIYGDPLEHPQKETYWGNVNPVGVRASYDEGKRCAETLCMDYHRQNKVDIKIVRIFNTFGPNMHPNDGRVVSNFVLQALRSEPITIYGDGSHSRSFQYIDDLIVGLLRMMETGGGFTGPVNIGNPSEFTVKELAVMVLKLIPESKSKIIYCKLPEDDPKHRRPDISLARAKLNWKPKVPLEEGLAKTIEYFRKTIKD